MHPIGPLPANQTLACADAPGSWLSNGENPTSLSCSYQKLFKKYPPAFFFEMGSILDGRPLRGKSSTVPVSLNFLFIDEIVVR
jgi:hypothetical protein